MFIYALYHFLNLTITKHIPSLHSKHPIFVGEVSMKIHRLRSKKKPPSPARTKESEQLPGPWGYFKGAPDVLRRKSKGFLGFHQDRIRILWDFMGFYGISLDVNGFASGFEWDFDPSLWKNHGRVLVHSQCDGIEHLQDTHRFMISPNGLSWLCNNTYLVGGFNMV